MTIESCCNERGVTLLELLVALVIFGIVSAGSYRLFVAQTKAYTVQDQVVEIQQNIRTAMEILLRDLRMAGFDNDRTSITYPVDNSIIPGTGDHSVTVNYEKDDTHRQEVTYSLIDGNLKRRETTFASGLPAITEEGTWENVEALNFAYGVDIGDPPDGAMDDYKGEKWVSASTVNADKLRVVAVRVVLTAKPDPTKPDVQKMVNPRTLESRIALRNITFKP